MSDKKTSIFALLAFIAFAGSFIAAAFIVHTVLGLLALGIFAFLNFKAIMEAQEAHKGGDE